MSTSTAIAIDNASFAPTAPRLRWLGKINFAESAALTRLAIPMTATALVNMGMSITDVIMMGRIGPEAVAAGAIVSDYYSIIYYLGAGVLAAAAPEIAQAIGGNRRHAVRQAAQQGLWLAGVLAVAMFSILWFAGSALSGIGIDSDIVQLGDGYARMMAITVMPMMGVALWRNVYAALGLPRAFLIATLAALPLNAVADYGLMFGVWGLPEMGLAGAGVASAIVATSMFVGLSIYAQFHGSFRRYHFLTRFSAPNWRRLGEYIRVGAPVGASNLGEMGVFLFSTLIAGFFGVQALAAHAITLRLAGVAYALPIGLSQAATVRVGYAVGRRDNSGIRETAKTSVIMGTIAGLAVFAAIVLAADVLPWAFLDAGEASAEGIATMAATLLIGLAVVQIGTGFGIVSAGALRGLKDTKAPMIFGWIGFWGIGIATALILHNVADTQVESIWIGLATGAAATGLLTIRRLRSKLATLTEQG